MDNEFSVPKKPIRSFMKIEYHLWTKKNSMGLFGSKLRPVRKYPAQANFHSVALAIGLVLWNTRTACFEYFFVCIVYCFASRAGSAEIGAL